MNASCDQRAQLPRPLSAWILASSESTRPGPTGKPRRIRASRTILRLYWSCNACWVRFTLPRRCRYNNKKSARFASRPISASRKYRWVSSWVKHSSRYPPICRIASARKIATGCLIEAPQPDSVSRSIVSWSNGLGSSQIGIKSGPTILTAAPKPTHSGWYGDSRDRLIAPSPLRHLDDFLKIKTNVINDRWIVQPEAFFQRRAFEKIGGVREELYYPPS